MVLHIFYEIVRKVVYKREGARGGEILLPIMKWVFFQSG